ncbi:MAG TPA: hypothetical protein VF702_07030 [Allosphingosinicella sp.]
MIKKLSIALIAATAPLAAVSAQPATGESPAAEQTAQEPADAQTDTAQPREERSAERRICRRIDTTGSRTGGQRVCMTAEQWRRADY